MSKRRAIAIIIPGGIGTGKDNIGVPVLQSLVKLISVHYDLTVFQLSRTNPNYVAEGFDLISVYNPNSFIRLLKFPFIFRMHHKTKKFSAVHGFWGMPKGFLAVVVGKLFGIKSIVSLLGGDAAGLPQINYGRLHKPLMRQLIFWTLRNANHINALTQYLVNNLRSYGFKREVEIIPWGVSKEMFDYHPKALSSDGSYSFLHVANLHPVKDQTTLLKAFAIISRSVPSKLTIVGSGVDIHKVNGLITELQITNHVIIRDPIPYTQLSAIYHSSDILLHTSLSEGQSEVVTEAMSCGLVVCGTRVGLIHDLPECCVSADVGDYRSLAAKTIELIKDPERMNEIRIRAHHWTLEHDINWTTRKLISLYES